MNVQDAFHATVHGYAGGCEALAARLDMSAAILRNKANPKTTANTPSLADADRVIGITGDGKVLHALANNHGYVCVRVDEDVKSSDMAVLEMIALVWTSNGEVGAEVNEALADGRITARELEKVRDAVKRTESALEGMLARLGGMADK
jgi:hypothetical protein